MAIANYIQGNGEYHLNLWTRDFAMVYADAQSVRQLSDVHQSCLLGSFPLHVRGSLLAMFICRL